VRGGQRGHVVTRAVAAPGTQAAAGRVDPPLVDVGDALARRLERLRFGAPVAYVYHPLRYARAPWREYLRRYGGGTREVVLFGMNPGPFGMAQTGVPFGEVTLVRDWLGIEAPVGRPADEHPKRPVQGFACPRSEVSGARLWGWARERFATPERFFARFFVANYCPLLFLEASGRNLTPDKLRAAEREPLVAACDAALRRTVELLRPRVVVGVGQWAEGRARAALAGTRVRIGRIPHPSPASPAANRGWAPQAERALAELGLRL
jgi:single-strand selective monofunctional uracil DNA glycosylase